MWPNHCKNSHAGVNWGPNKPTDDRCFLSNGWAVEPLSFDHYHPTSTERPSLKKPKPLEARPKIHNGQLAVLFEAILQVTSHKVMFQNMWQILDHPKNTLKGGWHLEEFPLLWWFQLSGYRAPASFTRHDSTSFPRHAWPEWWWRLQLASSLGGPLQGQRTSSSWDTLGFAAMIWLSQHEIHWGIYSEPFLCLGDP
jgi:hypothetical protein